jgi:hypothetical protein
VVVLLEATGASVLVTGAGVLVTGAVAGAGAGAADGSGVGDGSVVVGVCVAVSMGAPVVVGGSVVVLGSPFTAMQQHVVSPESQFLHSVCNSSRFMGSSTYASQARPRF